MELYTYVLGLARTGLIFTGLQEGVGADPTWPNRARCSIPVFHTGVPYRCSIPCDITLGSGAGELTRSSGRLGAGPVRESSCLGRAVRCRVFSLSVPLLLLFPLFAVLLNCPYPHPPVSAYFLFHSPPHAGRGRGGRVALLLPAAAETKTSTWNLSLLCKNSCFLLPSSPHFDFVA